LPALQDSKSAPSQACGSVPNHSESPAIPDLEVVDVSRRSPLKAWAHGYPFRTVRWHFHPEYEIHLVTSTSGRSFIGDYVGSFVPGNLVIVGPNLPHNWISDIARDEVVPRRSIVVQFSGQFIRDCMAVLPELGSIEPLLLKAARGIEAVQGADVEVKPIFDAMLDAEGVSRIGLFFQLLGKLQSIEFRCLASDRFTPQPDMYANQPLNRVIEHVTHSLGESITQAEMAEISGFTPSAFSRAFKAHTGMTFVRYVNRLRIDRACELLVNSSQSVADICYQVGFNNLSNFNRQFVDVKALSPSSFRRQHLDKAHARVSAPPSNQKASGIPWSEKGGHRALRFP
jgi:AraC-like DNA-binding protein